MNIRDQEVKNVPSNSTSSRGPRLLYLLDACIILLMGCLLYYGCSWQFFRTYDDAAKYECYAVAFWQGEPALHSLPDKQCAFILDAGPSPLSNTSIADSMQRHGFPAGLVHFVASQSPDQSFHALPYEYPFLTIFPLSLSLFAPTSWSQVAFAIGMVLLAALIYIMLACFRSRGSAIAFALLIVAGAWGTAVGRFDLVPAALTLFALLYAVRSRWNWAFALLALATLLKFYPVVLLAPFLLAQQKGVHARWYDRHRWGPLGVFAGVCTGVMLVSLLLSAGGTLAPFGYFGGRPVQVESFSSSLLWLASLLRHHGLQFVYTFGSLNVLSSYATFVTLFVSVLLVVGLLSTFWFQWRAKIDLATSMLLTLLIVMITGKVFSPQYLIWLIPLVAYVGENYFKWLIPWIVICLLTTWIYPFIYTMTPLLKVPYNPLFYPVVTVRNFLLFGFIVALLIYGLRGKLAAVPILAKHVTDREIDSAKA